MQHFSLSSYSITDLNERAALEQQIMEFGQTPKQLFTKPHVARPSQTDVILKNHRLNRLNSNTSTGTTNSVDIMPSVTTSDEVVAMGSEGVARGNDVAEADTGTTDVWQEVGELMVERSYELHKAGVTGVKWSEDASVIYSIDQG